jgi:hypothetical protein
MVKHGQTCVSIAWWLDKPMYVLFLFSLAVTTLDDGLIQVLSCVFLSKISLLHVFWYQPLLAFNCSCLISSIWSSSVSDYIINLKFASPCIIIQFQ